MDAKSELREGVARFEFLLLSYYSQPVTIRLIEPPAEMEKDLIGRLTIAFAILRLLDELPLDTRTLKDVVSLACGAELTRLWFASALAGLKRADYVNEVGGVWYSTGRGL